MAEAIRLEHVGIPAKGDLFDTVVEFYTNLFGWKIVRELNPGVVGQRLTFIGDGSGGMLEILDVDGPAIPAPGHLAFVVPLAEFDAFHKKLSDAGVQFDPPTTNPAGDRLVFFHDPAGNRAQIVGRIKPME